MGRKLHRKVQTRPRPHLPIIFECPRCEAEAVKIEMNESASLATIVCSSCHITRTITDLKKMWDKVDIYGVWLDRYYEEQEAGIEITEEPTVLKEPSISIEDSHSPHSNIETPVQTQAQIGSGSTETAMPAELSPELLPEVESAETEITKETTRQPVVEPNSSGFQIPKARSEVLAAKKHELARKQDQGRKPEQVIQRPKPLRIDDYSKEYKRHTQKEELEKEEFENEEFEEPENEELDDE